MDSSRSIALSSQVALRRQLDTVANNIANMETAGYKAERPLFAEYVMAAKKAIPDPINEQVSMVVDYGTFRNWTQGSINLTGNSFDVALEGEGFLVVEKDGETRYTRHGRLQLDDQRRLITADGALVQGDAGPITLPEEVTSLSFARDGSIRGSRDGAGQDVPGPIGRLRLVTVADRNSLQPVGDTAFTTTAEVLPTDQVRVIQGALEGATVQPIVEMTQMVELQRRYESISKYLDRDHERQMNAFSKLARLS